MGNKIVGYFLLVFGLAVIILTGLNVYNLFVNHAAPVRVISAETLFSGGENSAVFALGIAPASLANLINITFHLLLAGFILNAAFRIASLGVMLARPIVVDLNARGLPKKEAAEKK